MFDGCLAGLDGYCFAFTGRHAAIDGCRAVLEGGHAGFDGSHAALVFSR